MDGLVGQDQTEIGPFALFIVDPTELCAVILAVCFQEGYREGLGGVVVESVRTLGGLATRWEGVDVGNALLGLINGLDHSQKLEESIVRCNDVMEAIQKYMYIPSA